VMMEKTFSAPSNGREALATKSYQALKMWLVQPRN